MAWNKYVAKLWITCGCALQNLGKFGALSPSKEGCGVGLHSSGQLLLLACARKKRSSMRSTKIAELYASGTPKRRENAACHASAGATRTGGNTPQRAFPFSAVSPSSMHGHPACRRYTNLAFMFSVIESFGQQRKAFSAFYEGTLPYTTTCPRTRDRANRQRDDHRHGNGDS
jgi:hypothetical protein